jgi:hypothetical protein
MLQVRGDANLAEKPLAAEHRGQLRIENLQGDAALVPDVAGEVDRGHPAASDLALDRVTAGQGDRERLERVHGPPLRKRKPTSPYGT